MADREIQVIQEDSQGLLHGVRSLLTQSLSIAPAATGNVTVNAVAVRNVAPLFSLIVAPAAGGGAYTYTVVLSTPNHAPGDLVFVKYTQPNSTNPTVVFKNATTGGTTLLTIAGAVNKLASALFEYNGTAWVLVRAGQEVGATLTLA